MSSILQLSDLSDLLHHSAKFFRQFMSQTPPLVPGLFGHLDHEFETCVWSHVLHDRASKLVRMEFCKAKNNKLHEFLVLYFTHPDPTVTAHAVVVVDRTVENINPSQSSAIASPGLPSQKVTEALDKAHVIGQRNSIKTYLSRTYGKYDTLCVLRYAPSIDSIPSAAEISTLLLAVSNHRHDYNLYEYNCYWYAGTVFEGCKSLFPGYEEECIKHGDRGMCRLRIPMLTTSSLPHVCKEYGTEWTSWLERRSANQQELERKLEEERRARKAEQRVLEGKLEEERRVHEEAQQAWEGKLEEERRAREETQQALKGKLEEERRAREETQQALEGKLEEERRAREEERRAREEERRAREEERRAREEAQQAWEGKLEEERRAREEAQRRYEQLQAELQVVRQTT